MLSTDINCNICKEKIIFNIEDDSTFITKKEKGTFYGTEIAVYRVFHEIENEKHINAVIVDKKGFYRGFVDSYIEESVSETDDTQTFHVIKKDAHTGTQFNSDFIEGFLYINTSEFKVVESFGDENLNIESLAEIMVQRVTEGIKIYKNQPEYYKMSIADKKFYIWIENDLIISFSIKKHLKNKINDFGKLANLFFSYIKETDLNAINKRNFNLLIKIVETLGFEDENETELNRLISDASLNFIFNVKVNLGDIIKFVNSTFKIDGGLLLKLFQGEATIIDLLFMDDDNIKLYKDFVKLMDFLDRRQIINVIDN